MNLGNIYRHRHIGLFAVIAFFIYAFLQINYLTAEITVDIELEDIEHSRFKVYWSYHNLGFAESRQQMQKVYDGRRTFSLKLPALYFLDYLRIDPIDTDGYFKINRIEINQPGFESIVINPETADTLLQSVQQIEKNENSEPGSYYASSYDPQFLYEIALKPQTDALLLPILVAIIFIILVCYFVYRYVFPHIKDTRYVSAMMFIVVTLCLSMATTSEVKEHPDEYVHIAAVDYYNSHWLPPNLDAEEVADTYSIYGVTRLSKYEIYYNLAGYFSRLFDYVDILGIDHGRLFNVLLLLGLAIACLYKPEFRIIVMPLLVSAQAWYLFSYNNSDALGLFLCFVLAYQVACNQSLFNRYLTQEHMRWRLVSMFALVLMFGSILLVKETFYFFALFVAGYILWRYFTNHYSDKRLFWKRVIAMGILALTPFVMRIGLDVAANGWNSELIYEQMREKHADPEFKPSLPLNEMSYGLYRRERGSTMTDIMYEFKWGYNTFTSMFGKYGYGQYYASENFYLWVQYSGLFLLAIILGSIVLRYPLWGGLLVSYALVCALLLVGMSFYKSWTEAFQPQGRYLLSILPIVGILCYQFRHVIWRFGYFMMIFWMYLLALYSFIFTGIANF